MTPTSEPLFSIQSKLTPRRDLTASSEPVSVSTLVLSVASEVVLKLGAFTSELNVAAPAALISRVRAVIVEPPSLPLNIISLSLCLLISVKEEAVLASNPISRPPSKNITLPASESRFMSPPESIVRLPASEIVELLIVMSSIVRLLALRVPPTTTFPPVVIPALNVAAPAADISNKRAVISVPPSLPLIYKSLSDCAVPT